MFIKVIINEQQQIVRADNGEVLGCRFDMVSFDWITSDNKFSKMHYGYYDDGGFHEMCQFACCSYECLCKQKPECRYTYKGNATEGFYTEVE